MRSIRERLQAMEPATSTPREVDPVGFPIDAVAPGFERVNDRGAHYLVDTSLPDPTEGTFQIRDTVIPADLGLNQIPLDKQSVTDVLFLDTETTGLDRGTGTHVFLVGVGFFDDGQFRVQQYFIRDLHEEASLLHDLQKIVNDFPILVTFNGRAFDWPLLYNRFILHGYRNLPEFTHWDLLPSSRRLWKHRLQDCSLGNLETKILGVRRYGDVPGYLIPQLYFDYLRTRDARPLRPVFSHNQEDIVSLARLADVLLRADDNPISALEHPIDRISCGLYLLERGDARIGEQLILENLDAPTLDAYLRGRAYRSLATCYKRQSRWTEAVELWRRMDRHSWRSPELAMYPLIELAKVSEHKFRDFAAAASYVERAMNLASLRGWDAGQWELGHRYARLRRRMQGPGTARDKMSIAISDWEVE